VKPKSAGNDCQQCGRKLRDAIFCPLCGRLLCCWTCFEQHASVHSSDLPASRPMPKAPKTTPSRNKIKADD
jgi:hypothetical protein